MVTTVRPRARSKPATIAVCCPKFPLKSIILTASGRSFWYCRRSSPEASRLPSFTNMTSHGLPISSMDLQSLLKREARFPSSL